MQFFVEAVPVYIQNMIKKISVADFDHSIKRADLLEHWIFLIVAATFV